MPVDRRGFLKLSGAASLAFSLGGSLAVKAETGTSLKVVFFDAFPVFDSGSVSSLAEQEFPGHGSQLINLWRIKQFEYQWLRVLSARYADFWQVTEESLIFACTALKLGLPDAVRSKFMNAFLSLKAWPDVPVALQQLKDKGLRLALLSNMTKPMLEANIKTAGLHDLFEQIISSDAIKTYKPDVRAYQLGLDIMKVERDEALFVAFAGWDAAGAKSFGYRTFWANRLQAPVEQLGVEPDFIGVDLSDLVRDADSLNVM